jgi:hypothetical protein
MPTPEELRLAQIDTQFSADTRQAKQVSGAINTGFRAISATVSGVSNAQKQAAWNKQLFKGKQGLLEWATKVGFPRPEVLASVASSGDKQALIKAYAMLDNWNKEQQKAKAGGTGKESNAFKVANEAFTKSIQSGAKPEEQLRLKNIALAASGNIASIKPPSLTLDEIKRKEDQLVLSTEKGATTSRNLEIKEFTEADKILFGEKTSEFDIESAKQAVNTFKESGLDESGGITGLGAFESFIPQSALTLASNALTKSGLAPETASNLAKYKNAFNKNSAAKKQFVFTYQKMLSGVAVSDKERTSIRDALNSAAGRDGISFLTEINKQILKTKKMFKGRIDKARRRFPKEVEAMLAEGSLILSEDIPDLTDLIKQMKEAEQGESGAVEATTPKKKATMKFNPATGKLERI